MTNHNYNQLSFIEIFGSAKSHSKNEIKLKSYETLQKVQMQVQKEIIDNKPTIIFKPRLGIYLFQVW